MSKFNIGDIVIVTGNSNNHQFEIGSKIVVGSSPSKASDGRLAYRCEDENDYWWVLEEEMMYPIEEKIKTYLIEIE